MTYGLEGADVRSWQIWKLAFKIIHLTTIVWPVWDATCADHSLKQRRMLRDVSTHWNSAFDMLDFRVSYKQAIKTVTDKCKLGLAKFVIDEHEWELLKQLSNVLKVRQTNYISINFRWPCCRSSRMQHCSFHIQLPTSRWWSQRCTTSMRCSQTGLYSGLT